MWITIIVFILLVGLDQLTKFLAEGLGDNAIELGSFLKLHLVYNDGAAFGLGSDFSWLLVVISAAAAILLGYLAMNNDWKHGKFGAIGMTMALAGCFGNLIDRICMLTPYREGVVDMISLGVWNWFLGLFGAGENTFNVADVLLIFGLIMVMIDYLFFYDKRARKYGYHSKRK